MTLFQALILGIIQGATEFLPISSSGHLVLAPWLLGWEFNPQSAFIFDVLVQWGTLLAVITYFRQDLLHLLLAGLGSLAGRRRWDDPQVRLAWLVVVASIPAGLLGLILKDVVSQTFENPTAVSVFLLVTAGLLVAGERIGKRDKSSRELTFLDAAVIGLAQAASLFPGISRSGATIAGGLSRNLTRPEAARFSFIMAVPVMLGAGLVALRDLVELADVQAQYGPLVVGFLAATFVGYLAIRWLLRYLASHPMRLFTIYCLVLGGFGLLVSVIRG